MLVSQADWPGCWSRCGMLDDWFPLLVVDYMGDRYISHYHHMIKITITTPFNEQSEPRTGKYPHKPQVAETSHCVRQDE
jgi:hypothetical protein